MIKKLQSYLNIVLIIFAIVGIIYFLFSLVLSWFKKDVVVTKENLKQYIVEDKLVTNYSLFGTLENCTDNLYEAFINAEYNSIYDLVGNITKKAYTKEEIQKEIKTNMPQRLGVNNVMDGNKVQLLRAYEYGKSYILEIQASTVEENVYIIVNVDLYESTFTIDLIM